ncbi:MAG: MBL fold metallo-hydrolase [Lachnospiraceae bacterium]|nr:MBL fold metallo-hydrolase [Lachnospiraceae bacterium]
MIIHELHYSNTNTYLIEVEKGKLLFDTGWAGTFPAFCRALGEIKVAVQDIDLILISHYHPDHMGIAQEIADQGAALLVPDVQEKFVHAADNVFEKEKNRAFIPVRDDRIRRITLDESTDVLNETGIGGRIIHTPGHSEDSISLFLDSGELFVGDLNPLYELEAHKGTQIEESWKKLLILGPKKVYYGHAKTVMICEDKGKLQAESKAGSKAELRTESKADFKTEPKTDLDLYGLVSAIIRLIDKGCDSMSIQKKTGADATFVQDVMRMYLTHQNVGVQGILDRIEIKNK